MDKNEQGSNKPRVTVLMSTYNGEKYLREQVDSILEQKNVDLDLVVRDDGSSDSTLDMLMTYGDRIDVIHGKNIGVGSSFMSLVCDVEKITEYYAFGDQDDIWLPQKMERAISFISDINEPALYCSNQMLVDKYGNRLGKRFDRPPRKDYLQRISNNSFSGCTMVWNRALHELISDRNRQPTNSLLKKRIHDVWVAAVASLVGVLVYDDEPSILYRQHEDNVVGVRKTNILTEWWKKIKDPEMKNGRSQLSSELYNCFADVIKDEAAKKDIYTFGMYKKNGRLKRKVIVDKRLPECTQESRIGFIAKVVLGLF